MLNDRLEPGDVVLVSFPRRDPQGRAQEGHRPAVITCLPRGMRYPLVIMVPITSQHGPWADANPRVYPQLSAGAGGLAKASTVLLDQVQSVDMVRVSRYLGTLAPEQYQPIRDGLATMC